MAEELQGLLDRIQKDALDKIAKEREAVVSSAKKESDALLAQAKQQAEDIVKKAKAEADAELQKSEAAMRQALRDILISLKTELLERLRRILKESVGTAMTAELMSGIIRQMVTAYISSGRTPDGVEALLSAKDLETMRSSLMASLAADIKVKPEFSLASDINAGIKIGFKGDDVFLDFSDDAIADLICSYLSPKLVAILKEQKGG